MGETKLFCLLLCGKNEQREDMFFTFCGVGQHPNEVLLSAMFVFQKENKPLYDSLMLQEEGIQIRSITSMRLNELQKTFEQYDTQKFMCSLKTC